eukprot:197349-Lingulodinium_polyedra.AAC.1
MVAVGPGRLRDGAGGAGLGRPGGEAPGRFPTPTSPRTRTGSTCGRGLAPGASGRAAHSARPTPTRRYARSPAPAAAAARAGGRLGTGPQGALGDAAARRPGPKCRRGRRAALRAARSTAGPRTGRGRGERLEDE